MVRLASSPARACAPIVTVTTMKAVGAMSPKVSIW